LLGNSDPVINGGGYDLGNAIERQITVLLYQFNESALAEFSEIVFRFGHAVAVCE